MVRARYRGKMSFRLLAASVCLIFTAFTSVGYAVPGAASQEPGIDRPDVAAVQDPPSDHIAPAETPPEVSPPEDVVESAPEDVVEPEAAAKAADPIPEGSATDAESELAAPLQEAPCECPPGTISGLKFEDRDRDGIRDDGEPGIEGRRLRLTGGPAGVDLSATTCARGFFTFAGLEPGTYTLNESMPDGWAASTDLPLTVEVLAGATTNVEVGNYLCDINRVFRLLFPHAPSGAEFFVRYALDHGSLHKVALTGEGPWHASVDVPLGSCITTQEWWASCGGRTVLLRSNASIEPLMEHGAEDLTYTGGLISGTKFHDHDSDGTRDEVDEALPGWEVALSRITGAGDPVPYATALTDADGFFCFDGLLPGDYVLSESVPMGWQQTAAPSGAITVCDGSRAEGMDFGNMHATGALLVMKTGPAKAGIGDTVEYRIVVRNTGETDLGPVDVSDPLTGFCETVDCIRAGETCEWRVGHTIAPTDSMFLSNTVTAVGVDPMGVRVPASGSWRIGIVRPSVMLIKTADHAVVWPGMPVTYTYEVVNTGDIALECLSVDDEPLGHIGDVCWLDPGECRVLTKTVALWQTAANTATVRGLDQLGHEVCDRSTANVAVRAPSMTLTKTPSANTVLAGEQVRYTFVVTNTGDEPICDISVTDDMLGEIGFDGALLQPGESRTFVKDAAHESTACVTNVATARAVYGDLCADWCGTLCATATATVCVVDRAPSVSIVKTVDRPRIMPGSTVTYTYTITNTGPTPLTSIRVTDDRLGAIGESTRLESGETTTMARSAVINTDTVNVGTVTAADESGREVSASDDASVAVALPAIRLEKTPDPAVVASGGVVRYTYLVTNIGDETLFGVRVDDDRLGRVGQLTLPLMPGGSTTFTRDTTITADVTNVATATGDFGDPGTDWSGSVTDTATASVRVVRPAISVTKATNAPAGGVPSGSAVTYTYVVTNTGDTSLTVALVDDRLGNIVSDLPLAVGASSTFTTTTVLTSSVTNIVTATGVDGLGNRVQDTATATVDVFLPFTAPDLAITKTASAETAAPGDEIVYTLRYRNVSGAAAEDFTITDTFDPDLVEVIDAAGGDTSTPGRIVWTFAGPLNVEDGERSVSYTLRVRSPLPAGTTRIDNVARIAVPDDTDLSNNVARESVGVEGLPFLPFTGGPFPVSPVLALLMAALGVYLVGTARRRASLD